jgi:hypothetical protein
MNAVEIEQAISELAAKLTYRLAPNGNTHAPQTASPWRFRKSEMNHQSAPQEQKHYGERK